MRVIIFSVYLLLFGLSINFQKGDKLTWKKNAYLHLCEVMDESHKTFWVYKDVGDPGNNFVQLARMASMGDEEAVKMDNSFCEHPYSGATCVQCIFKSYSNNWGGWYFQNGVFLPKDSLPRDNWGDYSNAGIDLTGSCSLSFWARGEKGGELVEFFTCGIGWNPSTMEQIAPFPDSTPKISLGFVELENKWKNYIIDLNGFDLSYVIGGFGWSTNSDINQFKDIIFYLDNIQFHKSNLPRSRFLVSYKTLPSNLKFDTIMKNVAFTYDNALALICFSQKNEHRDSLRAKLLADAFLYAIDHDRYFNDGRLRNAYQAGDLILPPGWTPKNRYGVVRMPGWWDKDSLKWYEDNMQVGSHTGNITWIMIALLTYIEEYCKDKQTRDLYLNAVIKLGHWVQNNCYDPDGIAGYTGGWEGPDLHQYNLKWKATEHNLDVYVAFMRLFYFVGDSLWYHGAIYAEKFVVTMWNSSENHFWTGTDTTGYNINKTFIPVDIQAWALLALKDNDKYRQAIRWAEQNCLVDNRQGFDFNCDKDGIWYEGTAQMCLAYILNDEEKKAHKFLQEIQKSQENSMNSNGKGIPAASCDSLTTGIKILDNIDWLYFNRLHIGATAWYIFALCRYNPYWNKYM